jgi:integrase
MRLTDLSIRALEHPTKGQKTYRDNTLPGFGLRVSQAGSKSFVLMYGQDRRLITIGRYPIITLSQAREEAKRLLAEITLGKVRPHSITYANAKELYLAEKRKNRRATTVSGYNRLLDRINYKGQLLDLTPHEFSRRLNRFKAPSERGHVLVASRAFFRWCIKRAYIDRDPTLGLEKPYQTPRKRVLTDDELRAIWHATEAPSNFNRIIRVAILTGQRRGELAKYQQEWLDGDIVTTPAGVSKNKHDHRWPIGAAIEYLPLLPFSNWGDAKAELDKRSGIKGYQIHDLRRTWKTRASALGVAPHVSERILGHITGLSPLERVYDQHHYIEEMRRAQATVQSHLLSLFKTG